MSVTYKGLTLFKTKRSANRRHNHTTKTELQLFKIQRLTQLCVRRQPARRMPETHRCHENSFYSPKFGLKDWTRFQIPAVSLASDWNTAYHWSILFTHWQFHTRNLDKCNIMQRITTDRAAGLNTIQLRITVNLFMILHESFNSKKMLLKLKTNSVNII